jgi:hypothetical protein
MRSKAGRIIDFIEAWCAVPEGKLMGEWMVLENWQRESLHQIITTPAKAGMGETASCPKSSYSPTAAPPTTGSGDHIIQLCPMRPVCHSENRLGTAFSLFVATRRSCANIVECRRRLRLRRRKLALDSD